MPNSGGERPPSVYLGGPIKPRLVLPAGVQIQRIPAGATSGWADIATPAFCPALSMTLEEDRALRQQRRGERHARKKALDAAGGALVAEGKATPRVRASPKADEVLGALQAAQRPLCIRELCELMPHNTKSSLRESLKRLLDRGLIDHRLYTIPGLRGFLGDYLVAGRPWPDLSIYRPKARPMADSTPAETQTP
jgi:hypothetical protein